MKNVTECPFLFLTPVYNEPGDDSIIVAKKEWFETMSIGDTYGNYGQIIDTEECGEYDVKAYNFFNGSNWESVIIESIIDEDIDFNVITDESLILKYWQAIEDKSYVNEDKGYTNFETEDFKIIKSHWAGTFAEFTIEEK